MNQVINRYRDRRSFSKIKYGRLSETSTKEEGLEAWLKKKVTGPRKGEFAARGEKQKVLPVVRKSKPPQGREPPIGQTETWE